MPASSLARTHESPLGRMAATNSDLATSMPTNTGAADMRYPPRNGSPVVALPCVMRARARATVRALNEGRATPRLTRGLEDRRLIELSPVNVRFMDHSIGK